MIKIANVAVLAALSFASFSKSTPTQSLDFKNFVAPRTDSSLVRYLGTFFLGADPYVYLYLSNGNSPTSFKALNGGNPVLKPTVGTGGVRDPSIVSGGGAEEGKKWYILGTDLNIGATNWDAAQRQGSKGIFVWDSTDLVNWGNERLVTVEDDTAGMVWAPDAIYDPGTRKYLVHWASKFYEDSDTGHTGNPSPIYIRYAYTSDFKTFSKPQTYIDKSPTNVIDLNILPMGSSQYVRFMKDETLKNVFCEVSTNGLFGEWTRPGGSSAYIHSQVEGPAAYHDNQVDGKVHLLLDFYSGSGYAPYESMNPAINSGWTASSTSGFPSGLRHGSVLPLNQTLYSVMDAKWA